MAFQSDLQATRAQLRAIASELVELSDTYEPTPAGVWTVENFFVAKAKDLVALAQTPVDHAVTLCTVTMEAASIKALQSINALQSIPFKGSISLSDLSQTTSAQPALLERLLRMATASNFIHKDAHHNYSHSHLSLGYISETMMAPRLFEICYESGLEKLIHVHEYIEHQRQATGKIEEPGASRDNTFWNPTTWQAGFEGKRSTYEIFQDDKAKMQKSLKGMAMTAHLNPYTGYYDFSELATSDQDRAVLVDVGGGHGYAIQHILAAHPDIKPDQCVLEDFPDVIASAVSSNPDLPKGVKFQAHDYFQPQPVKGARAYYFRAVAHNLSDANLVKVLEHVTPVMEKDSKILIAEEIIPENGATARAPMMDLVMMMIGGKERTEKNMREVCETAGLKVDGVWRAGGDSTYAITEASLK